MPSGSPSCLLRTPDRGWLAFDRASRLIVATRADDVAGCLAAAEAEARAGHYVAGPVTSEAAAAFGLAVHPPEPGGLPLACFAVYTQDQVRQVTPDLSTRDGEPVQPWLPSLTRAAYLDALAQVREAIADGETYQLNFTFRLRAPFDGDPRPLFNRLASAQDGGWSAWMDLGDHVVCSASPELFFVREHGRLTCRPMKGTAARGLTLADDRARADALRHSAKEQSENVMIVDLIRNDLGRVATVGSVEVTSLFEVERYPSQWHLTSTVTADTPDASLVDLFSALFPSGSVTGAPKARSMELIRDLESAPRGLYTGAIGLLEPGGRIHFNVAIRTAVVDRRRHTVEFGVGSGIVWESRAEAEFEECQLKAAILTTGVPLFDLLETLRWDPAEGFILRDRHLHRLAESAEFFGLGPLAESASLALDAAVAGRTTPARVRLTAGPRGVHVDVRDLTPLPSPLRVALAPTPIPTSDRFLYHKTTHRQVYDNARHACPHADTVLLWNTAGELTEGTEATLVVELDGQKVTPPVSCGLLPGTLRAELLAGGDITERVVRVEDLPRATRVWLVNSVRGWMDVTLLPPVPAA